MTRKLDKTEAMARRTAEVQAQLAHTHALQALEVCSERTALACDNETRSLWRNAQARASEASQLLDRLVRDMRAADAAERNAEGGAA